MKLQKTASETYIWLKALYDNASLSLVWVFVWFKRFQDCQEHVDEN